MATALIKFKNAGAYGATLKTKLPFATVEQDCVVLHSQLPPVESLNAHLVWLWGMLKHERRVIKSAAQAKTIITCECSTSKADLRIQPNGAEMLHLLGVELIITVK